jgi:uncharacterized protein YegL
MDNTFRNNALYGYFAESMAKANITNENKAALYFATIFGESKNFKEFESPISENDFNSELGNNATDDGSNYRGRGAILLKGKANYILAGTKLKIDLLNEPELAAFPSNAFKIAAWIWNENIPILKTNQTPSKGDANQLADGTFMSFTSLTHALTTDLSELKERANFIDSVLLELNYPPLKRGNGISCSLGQDGQDTGYAVPVCLLDFKKPYCGCEGTFENRGCPYGIIPGTAKCRSSSIVKCCKESLRNQLDLVFVVDTSGSIGFNNFIKIQKFLIDLVSNFEISLNQTRIALVEFNDKANESLLFSNSVNSNKVIEAINNLPYKGSGGTNTAQALELTNNIILAERRGMRGNTTGVPKVVMIITDGDSDNNKLTIGNATAIKDRGFSIITVGIGNLFTNENELIEMASSRNDAYKIDDYDKIATFLSSLSKSSNQKSAVVAMNLQIETQVSENSYKYLTVNLLSVSSQKIYIKLVNEVNGRTVLLDSFDDPNLKSDSDYLNETELVEPSKKALIRNSYIGTNVFEIDMPDNKKELYISVKGMNSLNKFDLIVSETPFVDETTTTPLTPPISTTTPPGITTTPPGITTTPPGITTTPPGSITTPPGITTTPPGITTTPPGSITTKGGSTSNKNTVFFVFLFLLIPLLNVFLE